jgi:hypothetical protein
MAQYLPSAASSRTAFSQSAPLTTPLSARVTTAQSDERLAVVPRAAVSDSLQVRCHFVADRLPKDGGSAAGLNINFFVCAVTITAIAVKRFVSPSYNI